ncbi:acyltransferase [Aureibaculum luteum]|uniref:acyltransferase n=1 Tax=Aureibaculum luteum TaxID=1548456 RepID=UPI001300574C|nr:acyltransferase [Aureibaculum luteum]
MITKRINYKERPICNQKVYLTGGGQIKIGKGCIFGYKIGGFHKGGSIEIQPRYKGAIIKIGNNVATNNNIFICSANHIEINDNTRIGQNVTIMDFEAHGIDPRKRNKVGEIGEIIIGENVWIGNNVIILKNSSIGQNSIIAAGAVVSGVFPDNVIIGGVPAKIIKTIHG